MENSFEYLAVDSPISCHIVEDPLLQCTLLDLVLFPLSRFDIPEIVSCVDADGLAEEDSFPGKLLNVILYSNDVLEREALINLP
uniref:Uncharacterized protein n=1 Tax=Solanum lycopersicum TaxID=4081 RepID=A0A3Q7FMK3_SOLLC